MRLRMVFLGGLGALVAAALWWRKNPSACPYGQRFWVEAPHPLITRERLREILAPEAGERLLEIGPGTGYYTLDLAQWIEPGGRLEIFDIQAEMLEHAMGRVRERELENVTATEGNAEQLPFDADSFDGVVLTTVLGEIPNRSAAMSEIARVLRPGGRLIVGELFGDPHYTSPRSLGRLAAEAELRIERRSGPAVGYFARLVGA